MKATTYKKPSEYSAANSLRRFFSKNPGATSLTVDEILEGAGRNKEEHEAANPGWLSNKLTGIYAHDLARPVYSHNPWRKLERLELTDKGKRIMADANDRSVAQTLFPAPKPSPVEPQSIDPDDITIEMMLEAAERINKKLTTQRVRVVLEDKM